MGQYRDAKTFYPPTYSFGLRLDSRIERCGATSGNAGHDALIFFSGEVTNHNDENRVRGEDCDGSETAHS